MEEYRALAKCVRFDVGVEDHGCPTLFGHFEYDESGCQGLGYMVDMAFLMRFMAVFGVSQLQEVNGKSCWVVFDSKSNFSCGSTSEHIIRIDPLHRAGGRPFSILDWRNWIVTGPRYSAHEMLTGEKPK